MTRTYLVVIDDSPEARVALRFAARRAAKTGGEVDVLAVVEPQDFVQWGGVQHAIEEEQRLRIEGSVAFVGLFCCWPHKLRPAPPGAGIREQYLDRSRFSSCGLSRELRSAHTSAGMVFHAAVNGAGFLAVTLGLVPTAAA